MIPLPFSKIYYHFGEPIYIKKDIKDDEKHKVHLFEHLKHCNENQTSHLLEYLWHHTNKLY